MPSVPRSDLREEKRQLLPERSSADALPQVNARFFPMPLNGALRGLSHGSDLREREAAEKPQIDHFGEPTVDFRQLVERVAQVREARVVHEMFGNSIRKRGELKAASPLERASIAGVIDDEPAHHTRRVTHESGAIRKGEAAPFGDIQIRFVQEGRRAQRQRPTVACQLALRETMELRIERREQGFGGQGIAVLCLVDQRRNGPDITSGHDLFVKRVCGP